eukprot:5970500-Prymnesium_polylepis.1
MRFDGGRPLPAAPTSGSLRRRNSLICGRRKGGGATRYVKKAAATYTRRERRPNTGREQQCGAQVGVWELGIWLS